MTTVRGIALALGAAAVLGCGGGAETPTKTEVPETEPGWVEIDEQSLDEVQRAQLDRAVTAQQEMASTLMAELKGELSTGSPATAVTVCRDMAPMIAEYIADEHGVRIGRTSHRLRNPANTAPEWAATAVEQRRSTTAFFAGPEGEVAVLTPIVTKPPCLTCHGPTDGLDEAVAASLAESYPEDRAVGFADGDLRGWFWVEVPPTAG